MLDDIHRPDILAAVSKSCRLLTARTVMREISKRVDRAELGSVELEPADRDYNIASTLDVLYGSGGVVKGEHEVVALAFAMHTDGQSFVLIMDDAGGRRMVRHHFAHLARFMTGTAGFVAHCHTGY